MKVGFTGTREGMSDRQATRLRAVLTRLKATEFVHGLCVGADAEAAFVADALVPRPRVVGRPADLPGLMAGRACVVCDEVFPARSPLARNRDIVDTTEVLVACPAGPEATRSGTWATVRYGRRLKRRIVVLWPDGGITTENFA